MLFIRGFFTVPFYLSLYLAILDCKVRHNVDQFVTGTVGFLGKPVQRIYHIVPHANRKNLVPVLSAQLSLMCAFLNKKYPG